jgi:hypothetical protein
VRTVPPDARRAFERGHASRDGIRIDRTPNAAIKFFIQVFHFRKSTVIVIFLVDDAASLQRD